MQDLALMGQLLTHGISLRISRRCGHGSNLLLWNNGEKESFASMDDSIQSLMKGGENWTILDGCLEKFYRSHSSIFKVSRQSLSKKKKIGCSVESVKKVHPKHIPELLAAADGNGDQWNFLNFFRSLRLGPHVSPPWNPTLQVTTNNNLHQASQPSNRKQSMLRRFPAPSVLHWPWYIPPSFGRTLQGMPSVPWAKKTLQTNHV